MNATLTLRARKSWILRETPSIYCAAASPPRTRVAVFGSYMGGYHVLKELLAGPLADRVAVVGVATDDPTQPFIRCEVGAILAAAEATPATAPLVLEDRVVPYHVCGRRGCPERLAA
jgi:hypothetical protein